MRGYDGAEYGWVGADVAWFVGGFLSVGEGEDERGAFLKGGCESGVEYEGGGVEGSAEGGGGDERDLGLVGEGGLPEGLALQFS